MNGFIDTKFIGSSFSQNEEKNSKWEKEMEIHLFDFLLPEPAS